MYTNSKWCNTWGRVLRLLPTSLPGKTRLARLLLKPHFKEKDIILHDVYGNTLSLPNFEEPVGFYLFVSGEYEPATLAFIRSQLNPQSAFIDVGANIGSFTVPVANWLAGSGLVIAIEASPTIFSYLEKNTSTNNLSNVILINAAAGENLSGVADFYDAPLSHFGMGSLAPQFNSAAIEVPCSTLDQILGDESIDSVSVIKIDVEGFEAAVLRGAHELLSRNTAPAVVFEFCDWAEERSSCAQVGDAQRILLQHGYSIWRLADYELGKEPLGDVITQGFETLVAKK